MTTYRTARTSPEDRAVAASYEFRRPEVDPELERLVAAKVEQREQLTVLGRRMAELAAEARSRAEAAQVELFRRELLFGPTPVVVDGNAPAPGDNSVGKIVAIEPPSYAHADKWKWREPPSLPRLSLDEIMRHYEWSQREVVPGHEVSVPSKLSPAHRVRASAEWSRQLREKVKSSEAARRERERCQVTIDHGDDW